VKLPAVFVQLRQKTVRTTSSIRFNGRGKDKGRDIVPASAYRGLVPHPLSYSWRQLLLNIFCPAMMQAYSAFMLEIGSC
jgi:hypothetical protein